MKSVGLLIAIMSAACGPFLSAQSAPPPGRTASLSEDGKNYALEITAGVAIAIQCTDGGPCKDVVVSTENAAIADVKGASFNSMQPTHPYSYATAVPAGVVVIGKSPGKTKVKIKTNDGSKTINVIVLAPPTPGTPASVATGAAAAP